MNTKTLIEFLVHELLVRIWNMNELVQMLAYTFAVVGAAVFVCWWKGDKK